MDGVATYIDHIPKSRYCVVPVSTEVRNAATNDCRYVITSSWKSSKKGLRIRLMVYRRGCQPVSVHTYVHVCVRACVYMYVCMYVCLSVYLSVKVCLCNIIYKFGIHFGILMRKL